MDDYRHWAYPEDDLDKLKKQDEELKKQNIEVDDLCGCTGKEKTWSNRVKKASHDIWCFYYQHLDDQMKKQLIKWKSNDPIRD